MSEYSKEFLEWFQENETFLMALCRKEGMWRTWQEAQSKKGMDDLTVIGKSFEAMGNYFEAIRSGLITEDEIIESRNKEIYSKIKKDTR